MRTFLLLAVMTGLLLWGALRVPQTDLPHQVLRVALFAGAAIFAGLLVSAMLQALFVT